MIIVTGSAIARAGAEEQMLQIAVEHVQRSRTEPGCISHEVSRDVENSRRFVFVERWSDMAALKVHFRVAASQNFAQSLGRLSDAAPEMSIYSAEPVDPR